MTYHKAPTAVSCSLPSSFRQRAWPATIAAQSATFVYKNVVRLRCRCSSNRERESERVKKVSKNQRRREVESRNAVRTYLRSSWSDRRATKWERTERVPGRGVDHPSTSSDEVTETVELNLFVALRVYRPFQERTLPFTALSDVFTRQQRKCDSMETSGVTPVTNPAVWHSWSPTCDLKRWNQGETGDHGDPSSHTVAYREVALLINNILWSLGDVNNTQEWNSYLAADTLLHYKYQTVNTVQEHNGCSFLK